MLAVGIIQKLRKPLKEYGCLSAPDVMLLLCPYKGKSLTYNSKSSHHPPLEGIIIFKAINH